jgi:hypothetical protein
MQSAVDIGANVQVGEQILFRLGALDCNYLNERINFAFGYDVLAVSIFAQFLVIC